MEKQIEAEMLEIIEKSREEWSHDVTDHTENEYIREGLLNAGYRKQEWISVEERLPAQGELVLVSSMDLITKKHGWFYLARYTDFFDGVKFSERMWFGEGGLYIFGQITHWMPLPEKPPKGVTE